MHGRNSAPYCIRYGTAADPDVSSESWGQTPSYPIPKGGGSAEDMSSDREENLGAAVGVANDVQPFVDTNNNKTRYIIVTLELLSINYRTHDRAC